MSMLQKRLKAFLDYGILVNFLFFVGLDMLLKSGFTFLFETSSLMSVFHNGYTYSSSTLMSFSNCISSSMALSVLLCILPIFASFSLSMMICNRLF